MVTLQATSLTLSRRSYRVVNLRIAALHIVRCDIRESLFKQDLFSTNFSHRTQVVATRCELAFCPASKTKLSASSKNLPLNRFICFRSRCFNVQPAYSICAVPADCSLVAWFTIETMDMIYRAKHSVYGSFEISYITQPSRKA